ncbi:hypothetical protein BDZ97DRAFT_1795989 [Flammula alnicola]|nr:hypothetical protein BDZ97DRAFT_1795989 [Flammula alnicola]
MTSLINKAGKKLFEKHLEKYTPADPLYEFYTNEHGKQKRRKRELPPGLSKRDARILQSVKKRAHYLDKGFRVFGMRFGWTFFIGLVPLVGDIADASLNYLLVVRPARRADIPDWLLRHMLLNNAVSAGEFLRIRGEEFLKMGGVVEDAHGNGRRTWKSGWFGGGGKKEKKGKQTTEQPTEQPTAGDVQQVKPGAGMSAPEVKDALPQPAGTSKKGSSHSGASSFSFFGARQKKSNTSPAPDAAVPAGDRGRFVENVDSTPAPLK